MNYTLSDFYRSDIVPGIRLLTKEINFSDIPIQTVSVQEFPFDDFIQENELVLSTALGHETNPALFLQLAMQCKGKGAAGILFAFKDSSSTISPDALDYANKASLPIFIIPWEKRFVEIQSTVNEAIKQKELAIFHDIQNTLFNYFFDSQPLSQAAKYISNSLNVSVEIENTSGDILAFCSRTNIPVSAESEPLNVDIHISDVCYGRLNLYGAGHLTRYHKGDVLEKNVAFPLSLWFNRISIENMTTTRLKNDFVWNLVNRKYTSFDEMAQQGKHLNFNLYLPYICLSMKAEQTNENNATLEYSNATAQIADRIEQIILQQGKLLNQSVMVANRSLEYVVFLENSKRLSHPKIHDFLDLIEEKIQSEFPSLQCYWGISEINPDHKDFERLYKNATLARQYCLRQKGLGNRFTYENTKKALITSVLSENSKIKKSADETLKTLLEYDKTSDIQLLRTLTEFIHSNYNITKTARNLHIHRQSLLYRLEKIESLTGMSLNNHDDLFVLEVFSRIYTFY